MERDNNTWGPLVGPTSYFLFFFFFFFSSFFPFLLLSPYPFLLSLFSLLLLLLPGTGIRERCRAGGPTAGGGGRPGDGAARPAERRRRAGWHRPQAACAAGTARLARARPGRRGGWERRRRLEAAERRRRLGVAASAAGSGGAGSGRQSGIGGRGGGATAARLVPGWQLAEEDATRRVARWLRPGGGGARAGPPVGGQGPRRSATPVGRDGRRPAEGRRGRGGLLVRLGRTMAERLEAAQTRLGRGSVGRSGCKRYGGVGRVEAGTVRGCRHLAWRLRRTKTGQWFL